MLDELNASYCQNSDCLLLQLHAMVHTQISASHAKMLMDIKINSPHRAVRIDTLNMRNSVVSRIVAYFISSRTVWIPSLTRSAT